MAGNFYPTRDHRNRAITINFDQVVALRLHRMPEPRRIQLDLVGVPIVEFDMGGDEDSRVLVPLRAFGDVGDDDAQTEAMIAWVNEVADAKAMALIRRPDEDGD